MKAYTAERWAAGGAAPLWNPLSGAGEPWLSQLQSGVFYPGDLPFHLPWPWGPLAGIALHLAIAASGMASLLSGLGSSRRAAVAGALVFAGGGAFLSLFPVYNNACTAAYLPWLFSLSRGAVRGRGFHGFALVAALSFLAGEPALAAAGVLASAFAAFLFRNEGERVTVLARTAFSRLAPGAILGVGLAAVALLPFASYVRDQGRMDSVTREEGLARGLGASDLADLVFVPSERVVRGDVPASRGGYLVALTLTPLAFLLALAAPAGFPGRRGFLVFLAALGCAGFLLALGASGGLAPALFDAGLLKGVRFPARWFVFSHLALSFAAGAGLDGWLFGRTDARRDGPEGAEPRDRWLLVWAASTTALVFGLLVLALGEGLSQRDLAASAALWAGTLVAGSTLVLSALRRTPGLTRLASAAVLVLLLFSPLLAQEPLTSVPSSSIHGVPPVLGERAAKGGRLFTIAMDRPLLMRWLFDGGKGWSEDTPGRLHAVAGGYHNLPMGIPTVGSPSPIGSPRRARLLSVALTGGSATRILSLLDTRHLLTPFNGLPGARFVAQTGAIKLFALDGGLGRAFFARSARAASDDEAADALRRPGFSPEDLALTGLESQAALEATGPGEPAGRRFGLVTVVRETPEEMELTTTLSTRAFLVVTRSWDPGWRAEVDGVPVALHRTFIALSGLSVEPGTHTVVLRYRPEGYRVGILLSAVSALLISVAWLSGRPPEAP